MILLWKNEVFRGYGGFGALGHTVYHRELVPKLVEGSWDTEICHVATSGTHTAAITKSGRKFQTFSGFTFHRVERKWAICLSYSYVFWIV